MSIEYFWLILGMMLVTFPVRWLPLALADRLVLPVWLREALEFVPIAALTAIIAPIIMLDDVQQVHFSWSNHGLLASIIAFGVGLWRKNLLLTIIVGLASFALLRLFA